MYASPFIDETFDIYNCQNYTLSIQCALDGFSFSILDTVVNKFIVLSEFEINTATPFELKNEIIALISKEPMLQQKFKRVKVCFLTREITLVPLSLFNSDEINTFFKLNFEENRSNELISCITNNQFILISPIPGIIKVLFENQFTNCQFYTPVSPLFYSANQLKINQNRMLVSIYQHSMFLIYQKGQDTELMNSFFVKNEADCLYYLLNINKQLMGDSKTEVLLSGKIKPKSELESILKKYFEKVHFAHINNQYSLSYTFHKEPEHYHLPTLELALCE